MEKRIKIKLLKSRNQHGYLGEVGSVISMSEHKAEKYIKLGLAELSEKEPELVTVFTIDDKDEKQEIVTKEEKHEKKTKGMSRKSFKNAE